MVQEALLGVTAVRENPQRLRPASYLALQTGDHINVANKQTLKILKQAQGSLVHKPTWCNDLPPS